MHKQASIVSCQQTLETNLILNHYRESANFMFLLIEWFLAELFALGRNVIGHRFGNPALAIGSIIMPDVINSPPVKKRKEHPSSKVNSPPVQNFRGTQPNPSQTENRTTSSNRHNVEDISDYVPVKLCDRCLNHIPVNEGDWVRIFPMYGLKWICSDCQRSVLYILAD
jgi:hypothetical protein